MFHRMAGRFLAGEASEDDTREQQVNREKSGYGCAEQLPDEKPRVHLKVDGDLSAYYQSTKHLLESILVRTGCTLLRADMLDSEGVPYQDLLFISQSGMVQRTQAGGISQMGRPTQGVKVMNMKDDDCVSAVALIVAGCAIPLVHESKAHGDTDTSRDYEYTDWADLEQFARDFLRRADAARQHAVAS
jgi:DNA gyrase/topoisomerase IV subunit A